mmetsp:Transcript_106002/g.167371  ORF Transcript_106002/g.167371 Transcript_106002/m.167371 type:complete len:142 (+) Transcript_106002:66-491(+)|eukprot:CAMPEP_0169114876 /NCGR_PEP_ID=MMETSP1015-20121227/29016_1 /TAXON_ID=342587 /ORGANISM="Karlodinium micrum, Strain CCMP2283" /LENGTH=141 /DNA_ID=CAMNT_0009177237 /DNA_START=66 /DNA_END=491 /DNA_ORIENTATION=+
MAHVTIPGFLVGQTATIMALIAFSSSIIVILALFMVKMKPEQLTNAARNAFKSAKASYIVDQELDLEVGLQQPKKKRSPPRKLNCFFVGEPLADPGHHQSIYELDDEAWLAPEKASADVAAQQLQAFDLPDECWQTPFIEM